MRVVVAIQTIEIRASVFLALADEPRVDLLASASQATELATFCRAFAPDVVVMEEGLSRQSDVTLLGGRHVRPERVLVIPSPDSHCPASANVVADPRDLVSLILSAALAGSD